MLNIRIIILEFNVLPFKYDAIRIDDIIIKLSAIIAPEPFSVP